MALLTSIETTVRVRYAETDAMGIVHHASYLIWLEVGRTELLRARGTSYREIEDQGLLVVLGDLVVRYHAPARYDDLIIVRTTLSAVRSRQLCFDYSLRLAERDTPLLTARTSHIVLDRATRRPTRLTAALLDQFRG